MFQGFHFIDGELSLRNPYIRHEIEGLTEGPTLYKQFERMSTISTTTRFR